MKIIGLHPVVFWEMFDNWIFGKKTLICSSCWFPWCKCYYQGWFQATNTASLNGKSRRDPCSISTIRLHPMQVTSRAQIKCSYFIRDHWNLNIYYSHFKYNLLTWMLNLVAFTNGFVQQSACRTVIVLQCGKELAPAQNWATLREAGVGVVGLGWGPRICISNMPGDVHTAIPCPTLRTNVLEQNTRQWLSREVLWEGNIWAEPWALRSSRLRKAGVQSTWSQDLPW